MGLMSICCRETKSRIHFVFLCILLLVLEIILQMRLFYNAVICSSGSADTQNYRQEALTLRSGSRRNRRRRASRMAGVSPCLYSGPSGAGSPSSRTIIICTQVDDTEVLRVRLARQHMRKYEEEGHTHIKSMSTS